MHARKLSFYRSGSSSSSNNSSNSSSSSSSSSSSTTSSSSSSSSTTSSSSHFDSPGCSGLHLAPQLARLGWWPAAGTAPSLPVRHGDQPVSRCGLDDHLRPDTYHTRPWAVVEAPTQHGPAVLELVGSIDTRASSHTSPHNQAANAVTPIHMRKQATNPHEVAISVGKDISPWAPDVVGRWEVGVGGIAHRCHGLHRRLGVTRQRLADKRLLTSTCLPGYGRQRLTA